MELTEKQKKTLKLFSMYIQSHGAKSAGIDYHYDAEGEFDYKDSSWTLTDSNINADSYDAIDNLINEIIENYDLLNKIEYYDNLTNFVLEFKIDCITKTFKIIAFIYTVETESSEHEVDFDDEFDEENLKELRELSKKYGDSAEISYDGSGDSGYIDNDMVFKREQISTPSFVEDKLYHLLESHYGGWEINEGSNGTFHFNFVNEVIIWNHSQNYDQSYRDDITTITF